MRTHNIVKIYAIANMNEKWQYKENYVCRKLNTVEKTFSKEKLLCKCDTKMVLLSVFVFHWKTAIQRTILSKIVALKQLKIATLATFWHHFDDIQVCKNGDLKQRYHYVCQKILFFFFPWETKDKWPKEKYHYSSNIHVYRKSRSILEVLK